MQLLSRRTFSGWLVALTAFPFLGKSLLLAGDEKPVIVPPSRVAGHDLTEEEKQLAKKFLEGYEQTMAPLRQRDLPNSLSPAFAYASPRMPVNDGGQSDER